MSKNNVLGGFSAVFDSMNAGYVEPKEDEIMEPVEPTVEPKEDEKEPDVKLVEPPVEEDVDDIFAKVKAAAKGGKVDDDDDDDDTIDEPSEAEEEYVTDMFDVFVEKYGWEVKDEEKPKTIESLMEHIEEAIAESSVPEYASDEVRQLDEFVRNGGNIIDFFKVSDDINVASINIESEDNQRKVVSKLLEKQGLNEKQIQRKLDKYEDAGILSDEAEEALELLQEYAERDKEQLLANQQRQKEQIEEEQRKFYSNVVNEIKTLKDVRGIAITESEKKDLLEYLFKPTKNGNTTKFQEDFSSGVINLVEAAYFTKNKDKILNQARKEGEQKAVERLKNKLKTGTPATSKKRITGSTGKALWEVL